MTSWLSSRRAWSKANRTLLFTLVVAAVVLVILAMMPGGRAGPAIGQLHPSAVRLGILARAVAMYQHINQQWMPDVDAWPEQLRPYLPTDGSNSFESPDHPGKGRAYAMNAGLRGLKADAVASPALTVLFFEAEPGCPLAGGAELLTNLPPKGGGHFFVFCDGHSASIAPSDLDKVVWSSFAK